MRAHLVEWDLYRHLREDHSVRGSSSALDWPQADGEALSQHDSAGLAVVALVVLDASSPSVGARDLLPRGLLPRGLLPRVLLPRVPSSSSLLDDAEARDSAVRASLALSCLSHEALDLFSP